MHCGSWMEDPKKQRGKNEQSGLKEILVSLYTDWLNPGGTNKEDVDRTAMVGRKICIFE